MRVRSLYRENAEIAQGKYSCGVDRPERNCSSHNSSVTGQELTSWDILHPYNPVPPAREPMAFRPHLYAILQSSVVLTMADQTT